MKGFYCLISIAVAVVSCKKPETKKMEETIVNQQSAVLVINEGNFQWGNASIDLLDLKVGKYTNDVYKNANALPLGDVCQSASIINGKLFLVVNNSGKIVVCDTSNFKATATISNLTSPRYICLANNELYVTDLFANKVIVLNADNFAIIATIPSHGWTEEIISLDGKVYFMDVSVDSVMHINRAEASALGIKTILGKPIEFVQKGADIEVMSYLGDSLILTSLRTNKQIIYPDMLPEIPSKIQYDSKNDQYFVLFSKAVYVLKQQTNRVFYSDTKANFSALSLVDERILLANAKDYVKKSDVIILDKNGAVQNTFESGNITNGFLSLKP